jgi:hypothetical protein
MNIEQFRYKHQEIIITQNTWKEKHIICTKYVKESSKPPYGTWSYLDTYFAAQN